MSVPESAYLLIWVVVVAVSISVILLSFIFAHRINQLYVERKMKIGVDELLPHFESFILGNLGKDEFLELARPYPNASLHLILRYLVLLKGKAKQQLFEVASGLGFVNRAVKGSKSMSWKTREIAAMELGIFGHNTGISILQKMVQDPRMEVRHTALRSMSLLDSSKAFGALIELLDQPGQLDVARIMEIVREVNNPDVEVLNNKLNAADMPRLTRLFLIDLVGEWAEYRVAATLHDLIKGDNKEIAIRSIKSLGRIGNEASIPHLIALIDSDEWEIRAQAIRAIATFEYMEALPLIANCLADQAFWVRRAAAEVLISLGPEGQKYLQIENLPDDRFARDIASYITSRGNGTLQSAEITSTKSPAENLQLEQT